MLELAMHDMVGSVELQFSYFKGVFAKLEIEVLHPNIKLIVCNGEGKNEKAALAAAVKQAFRVLGEMP